MTVVNNAPSTRPVTDPAIGQNHPRPVVVGFDGSAAGMPALDLALREARQRRIPLQVVAAWSLPAMGAGWGMTMPYPAETIGLTEELEERSVRTSVEHLLRHTVASASPDVDIEVLVRQGRPSAVLLDAAGTTSLLVVGARGHGAWGRLALGSTSTEVVHHARCPVLVVPCPED